MDTWCQEHHGASGLTAACAASRTTVAEAESLLLAAVRRWAPQAGEAVLAGSSVHADRGFLARDMKALVGHLHYRIVDVSSIKELLRRWDPRLLEQAPAKTSQHRALSDIRESIAELQFYREHAFAAGVRQMS
ncbi:hypothetical protein HK405_002226 [Cladochytrium tenue]|nr:hypothetical protein HK405_002226 [Cladochytrium tenue]